MIIRILMITLMTSFLFSCQGVEEKQYDSSLIKRDKINGIFGKDVSDVLFDHLYVVVDSTTYASITQDSKWKNKYATLDNGLPDFAPAVKESSSCYLRGHQHSIEILDSDNIYNEPVGKSGIGFSLKNKGEHFHLGVKPKLREVKDSLLYATSTVKMPVDGEEYTWFKAFYKPSKGTGLHTWYGFYNPNFLDHLKGEEHAFYSRKTFLESSYADHKLFNSIEAIQLKCTKDDFNQ